MVYQNLVRVISNKNNLENYYISKNNASDAIERKMFASRNTDRDSPKMFLRSTHVIYYQIHECISVGIIINYQ